MSKVDNNYTSTSFLSEIIQKKQKGIEEAKGPKTKAASAAQAEKAGQASQVQLSAKAQKLLEKLKANYKDMDFMVADYSSGAEAKDILSRGTKEYSVLFSSEELEKMASDEKYEKEYMDKVQGAVDMTNKINEQFKNEDKGELTSVGISFNSDGTTTMFAQLEKSSDQQKTRIEETRAKNAADKKAAEKKAAERRAEAKKENAIPAKKVTVQASSVEELIAKLNEVDWSKVTDRKKTEGDKFDFTV